MKIDTAPFEGVASQDSEMSRAEREHRLWLRGYPRKPNRKARIWTRSEAIEVLRGVNELTGMGTIKQCQKMRIGNLEKRMRESGWKSFFLIDDPQPGDFL